MRSLSPVLDMLWLAGNRKEEGGWGGAHSHLVCLLHSGDTSRGKVTRFVLEVVFLF